MDYTDDSRRVPAYIPPQRSSRVYALSELS